MALSQILPAGNPGTAVDVAGSNMLAVIITGTGTVKIEVSIDGTNWVTGFYATGNLTAVGGLTLAPGDIAIPYCGGVSKVRQNTLSGVPVVTLQLAVAST